MSRTDQTRKIDDRAVAKPQTWERPVLKRLSTDEARSNDTGTPDNSTLS